MLDICLYPDLLEKLDRSQIHARANSAMPRIGAVVNQMMQIDGERIISQGFWMNKKLLERLLLMKYTFELNISLTCSRLSNVKVNFPPIAHTFKDYGFQPF